MRLPPKAIKEFQELWLRQFGVSIDEQTARLRAEKMLSLLATLFNPTVSPNNKGPP